MQRLDPERWRAVSPYLDQALEVRDEAELSALRAAVRRRDPRLADDLDSLLEEHRSLSRSNFLEGSVAEGPLQVARAGDTIGPYTLATALGQGGMGTVWLARRSDGRFEREVAIKLPTTTIRDRFAGERFRREGLMLGRLSHPHIASLMDAGVSPSGQPFLVLEYVDGAPIDRHADDRCLDVHDRIRLLLGVMAAVDHAHTHLIVHRDLKPSNVMVTAAGQVKLLDFGVAKLLEADAEAVPRDLTREGGTAITLEYAAPEQVTGRPVTTATDVYALGVLLYLLLTGRHPVGSGMQSTAEIVKAIVEVEPLRMSQVVLRDPTRTGRDDPAALAERRASTPQRLAQALSGDLDTIVARALKKAPEDRYPSVAALADDLQRYLAFLPIMARRDSFGYRAARFVRRQRVVVALAALAAVASASGVVGTLLQAKTARRQRDFAVVQLARAEAINDLNHFLLSDAAPSGRPFTVLELLARAEHILERQPIRDGTHVHLLVAVGRQYASLDEHENALRVLQRAYDHSRALVDDSARGQASCALASTLAHGPELNRAEALFREGLDGLPAGPSFALDRVFCLLRGAEVARYAGRAQEAVDRVLAAQTAVARAPARSDMLTLRILMDLAESYRELGRYPEAIHVFRQADAELKRLGRDNTQTAGTLLNNWALTLDVLGRVLEAEPLFRRAIDISRDDRGEEAVSPMLLTNYARTLESLDRLDEAARIVPQALARARRAGDDVIVNQSLLVLESVCRKRGDLDGAAVALEEVEQRLRRALPPGHFALGVIDARQAFHAQARGDLAGATALVDHALARLEAAVAAGGGGAYAVPLLLLQRSDLGLARGDSESAEADALRAIKLLVPMTAPGDPSRTLGQAYLALGRAQAAGGREEEANLAFSRGLERLSGAVGQNHPDLRAAKDRLAGHAGA